MVMVRGETEFLIALKKVAMNCGEERDVGYKRKVLK
jgi:hypothetical protein